MRTLPHQFEDRLLEFAYGELPPHEAGAVEDHVKACDRCGKALAEIRAVRATMQQLPAEEAPAAGLESLLAYAEAQARRNAAGATRHWWSGRWGTSLASAFALSLVVVVAWRARDEFQPEAPAVAMMKAEAPAPAAAPAGVEPQEQKLEAKADLAPASPPGQVAQAPAKVAGLMEKKRAPSREAAVDDGFREREVAVGSLDSLSLRSGSRRAEAGASGLTDSAAVADARADAPAKESLAEAEAAPPPAAAALALPAAKGLGSADNAVGGGARPLLAKAPGPPPRSLAVQRARQAGQVGDRAAELRFAVLGLQAGAVGAERGELLALGCQAAEAVGDAVETDRLCDQLLLEYPRSPAALALASRRNQVQAPAAAPPPAGKKQ